MVVQCVLPEPFPKRTDVEAGAVLQADLNSLKQSSPLLYLLSRD